ncbi:MAG: cytochrome c3 family protein [Myxococcota bacterium]|nr:cytochrome c3 family protein [Myxococcota bacterium]
MQWTLWLLPLSVVVGAIGWGVSDRVEQRNDFCNACHLPDGTALHRQVRDDFDRVMPLSLAGVHGRGWVEEREDSDFRCIDCHAGSGPVERTKIKLLAARDAVRYAIGRFEEPEGMPFDLSAGTCLGCHPTFRSSAAPGWTVEAYHGLDAHDDAPDGPACVSCHAVHPRDGDAFAYFMQRERVDRQCQVCHSGPDGPGIR